MYEGYCVKCKSKQSWKEKPKLGKTKNNRFLLVGNCRKCNTKMTRFVSNSSIQSGDGLLSNLIGKPIPFYPKSPY